MPISEAAQKGIDFEDAVYSIADGKPCDEYKKYALAVEVANIIKGGQFQVRVKTQKRVAGIDFLLYGKLDALKAGAIYDIKYSEGYEPNKYLDSAQHPMYFECVPEAREFVYLVCDGTDICREAYRPYETKSIDTAIEEFIDDLKRNGLLETYFTHWKCLYE